MLKKWRELGNKLFHRTSFDNILYCENYFSAFLKYEEDTGTGTYIIIPFQLIDQVSDTISTC